MPAWIFCLATICTTASVPPFPQSSLRGIPASEWAVPLSHHLRNGTEVTAFKNIAKTIIDRSNVAEHLSLKLSFNLKWTLGVFLPLKFALLILFDSRSSCSDVRGYA